MEEFTIIHRDDIDPLNTLIREYSEGSGCIVRVTKIVKGRTIQQNKALHKWLTMMAKAMSDAGYSHRKLWEARKESFDIPVSMEHLKEIAQGVSLDRYGTKHTSELTTVQFSELYEILNLAFGQAVGVSIPFPSRNPPQIGRKK